MKKLILVSLCAIAVYGCSSQKTKDTPPMDTTYNGAGLVSPPHTNAPTKDSMPDKNAIPYESCKKLTKAFDGTYWECWDVVIRPINPSKDDYKAICRYIITDIISQKGANKHGLSISIYDNKEAFCFDSSGMYDNPGFEMDDNKAKIKAMMAKWKKGAEFADKHRICIYMGEIPSYGKTDDSEDYMLHFYDGMGGGYKYKGEEKFRP